MSGRRSPARAQDGHHTPARTRSGESTRDPKGTNERGHLGVLCWVNNGQEGVRKTEGQAPCINERGQEGPANGCCHVPHADTLQTPRVLVPQPR